MHFKEVIDGETGEILPRTKKGNISTAEPKISKRTGEQIQECFARKHANYFAKMRSNLALIHRSDTLDDLLVDHVRSELKSILDSGILTYPPTLELLGVNHKMTLDERKRALGVPLRSMNMSDLEQRFMENMAYKAEQCRKANWSWRIAQEAEEKQQLGWHPFFVTLTVDPKRTDPKTLWQEGREFRKYIRKLAKIVAKELKVPPPHKPPYKPESEFVTYAGVIEHGKSREHHHGHFCIWLRAIPSSWRICPNYGVRNPANCTDNECREMSTVWKWSSYDNETGRYLSPALYFRSVGDIWSNEYNFVLPIKDGQPMRVSTARAAGAYITKYLSKEHREWHHRMKATRNLGMRTLIERIRDAHPAIQEALSWRAQDSQLNHSLMMTHSCPIGLVRSVAKRMHYLSRFRRNQLDLQDCLQSNGNVFIKMLSSVRAGHRPDRMRSSDFFDWVGKFLVEEKGYCKHRQIAAHVYLGQIFPHVVKAPPTKKLGGCNIGYS